MKTAIANFAGLTQHVHYALRSGDKIHQNHSFIAITFINITKCSREEHIVRRKNKSVKVSRGLYIELNGELSATGHYQTDQMQITVTLLRIFL